MRKWIKVKWIKITTCDECNSWDMDSWRCRREDRENDNMNLEIPVWCPIEDKPKD